MSVERPGPKTALLRFRQNLNGSPILGNAHLEAARLHERLGHKDDAVSGYRIASTLFGAAADTRAAASRALARLNTR